MKIANKLYRYLRCQVSNESERGAMLMVLAVVGLGIFLYGFMVLKYAVNSDARVRLQNHTLSALHAAANTSGTTFVQPAFVGDTNILPYFMYRAACHTLRALLFGNNLSCADASMVPGTVAGSFDADLATAPVSFSDGSAICQRIQMRFVPPVVDPSLGSVQVPARFCVEVGCQQSLSVLTSSQIAAIASEGCASGGRPVVQVAIGLNRELVENYPDRGRDGTATMRQTVAPSFAVFNNNFNNAGYRPYFQPNQVPPSAAYLTAAPPAGLGMTQAQARAWMINRQVLEGNFLDPNNGNVINPPPVGNLPFYTGEFDEHEEARPMPTPMAGSSFPAANPDEIGQSNPNLAGVPSTGSGIPAVWGQIPPQNQTRNPACSLGYAYPHSDFIQYITGVPDPWDLSYPMQAFLFGGQDPNLMGTMHSATRGGTITMDYLQKACFGPQVEVQKHVGEQLLYFLGANRVRGAVDVVKNVSLRMMELLPETVFRQLQVSNPQAPLSLSNAPAGGAGTVDFSGAQRDFLQEQSGIDGDDVTAALQANMLCWREINTRYQVSSSAPLYPFNRSIDPFNSTTPVSPWQPPGNPEPMCPVGGMFPPQNDDSAGVRRAFYPVIQIPGLSSPESPMLVFSQDSYCYSDIASIVFAGTPFAQMCSCRAVANNAYRCPVIDLVAPGDDWYIEGAGASNSIQSSTISNTPGLCPLQCIYHPGTYGCYEPYGIPLGDVCGPPNPHHTGYATLPPQFPITSDQITSCGSDSNPLDPKLVDQVNRSLRPCYRPDLPPTPGSLPGTQLIQSPPNWPRLPMALASLAAGNFSSFGAPLTGDNANPPPANIFQWPYPFPSSTKRAQGAFSHAALNMLRSFKKVELVTLPSNTRVSDSPAAIFLIDTPPDVGVWDAINNPTQFQSFYLATVPTAQELPQYPPAVVNGYTYGFVGASGVPVNTVVNVQLGSGMFEFLHLVHEMAKLKIRVFVILAQGDLPDARWDFLAAGLRTPTNDPQTGMKTFCTPGSGCAQNAPASNVEVIHVKKGVTATFNRFEQDLMNPLIARVAFDLLKFTVTK